MTTKDAMWKPNNMDTVPRPTDATTPRENHIAKKIQLTPATTKAKVTQGAISYCIRSLMLLADVQQQNTHGIFLS